MPTTLPSAQQLLDQLEKEATGKEEECPICMDDFGAPRDDGTTPEHAVILPGCNHVVGSACISQWLTSTYDGVQNVTCPLCRQVLCHGEGTPRNRQPPEEFFREGTPGNRQTPEDFFRSREVATSRNRNPRQVREMMSIAAVMGVPRNTEPEPRESRAIIHMRQWLRRRVEADPPTRQAAIAEWFAHRRQSTARFRANTRPINHNRLRWTHYREMQLYTQLRVNGADLPSLPASEIGPDGLYMNAANETAFLEELRSRGAFEARPNSSFEGWTRGLSPREIWKIFRVEGYVYGALFDLDRRGDGYHGWVGMLYDETYYPSILETEQWLLD